MALPTSTEAAVLTTFGEDLERQELPLPTELEPGAVLVEIVVSTLCGTDVEIWQGKMPMPEMLPMVLGHEMIGRIVAVGPGARDVLGHELRVGERIGWSESTCGRCRACRIERRPVGCEHRGYGFLQRSDRFPYATAGLARHAYVTPDAEKLLLPDDVDARVASMAGCAAKTVLRAFDRAGGIRVGDDVVIQGSGALGLFATAVARLSGARRVVTVGAPQARLDLATRFGADVTVGLEGGAEARIAAVLEATGGRGAQKVFDFAGAPGVGAEGVHMTAARGTFVVVGSTGPTPEQIVLGEVMGKEMAIAGSLNGDVSDYHHSIEFFTAFASAMPWHELFSPAVGLAGASAALRSLAALETVKAVIDPSL